MTFDAILAQVLDLLQRPGRCERRSTTGSPRGLTLDMVRCQDVDMSDADDEEHLKRRFT